MTNEQKNAMRSRLNGLCSQGTYCQVLFDPIQTHAIYGVYKEDKESMKQKLKSIGAKKFRMVQPEAKGKIIICFDASSIK